MPLFEVAILLKPTKKEFEEGKAEKLIFGPTAVVANDGQSAAVAAVLDEKSSTSMVQAEERARMEILVRPFVASALD